MFLPTGQKFYYATPHVSIKNLKQQKKAQVLLIM